MVECMARWATPDVVPVLSRGKHRNPRKGGCFMEYASLLAGEKWSDHPKCTHYLLAGLARAVNDHTSDAARSRLVGLIPSVIGLTGDDPRVDARIAMRCAAKALPVAAEYRQRALAVGLITARKVLVESDDGTLANDPTGLLDDVQAALARVPQASRWAEEFTAGIKVTLKGFRRRSARNVVRVAVVGIAEAAIHDPDDRLHDLLDTVIQDCTHWLGSHPSVDPAGEAVALADTPRVS